jgi:dipeptidyl aminopeptidase/acylaminoacyl peptidase
MTIDKAGVPGHASAVLALTSTLLCASAAGQAPPAEAFAALPAMESPSISADGTRLAFVAHSPTGSYVLVAKLDGMQVTNVVEVNEGKLRDVFWANDEALVFTASATTGAVFIPGRIETSTPYGIDLSDGGAVTRLLRTRERVTRQGGGGATTPGQAMFAASGAQLVGWERNTGRVLYPKLEVPDFERVLYAVDPKDDRQILVDRGSQFTLHWIVDESGEPIFRVDYTDKTDQYTLLGRTGGRWEIVISETVAIPEMSVLGMNDAGELIVRARPINADFFGLYTLSTETGSLGETVLADRRLDVGGARIDPYTNRVIGSSIRGPIWFDEELAGHQSLLDETFEGEYPYIASWSEDRGRFIVLTEGNDRAPAIYLYDAAEPSVAQIGSVYAGLQSVQLAPRRGYEYTARDGTSIPAYLTRPPGASGPTALVVLPHGGPASRDYDGFDWIAHFLASRGYTVLQPNFRGSAGFGDAWETAGHGEWGIGVMQHDISDGVAALIAAELADPDRVCIVGASYGGYAALAGAVFTPEIYRCAAAIAPVSDLSDMFAFARNRQGGASSAVSYWLDAMGGGNPAGLNDRLRAASPAAHAARANAPILLVHGRDDSVVPIEQSRAMESALRAAGKEVELIELDGEDHWLSVAPTRLATLEAIENFLGEHLSE